MKRRNVLGLAVLLPVLVLDPEEAWADGFVLIRNAKNGTRTLSKADLRKLYTGQTKQWAGAVVQTVLGEPDTPELAWLAGQVFGMPPKDLLTRIKQEVFRGEMKRPVMARSSVEAIAAVERLEGGIGVIPAAAASGLPAGVATVALTD